MSNEWLVTVIVLVCVGVLTVVAFRWHTRSNTQETTEESTYGITVPDRVEADGYVTAYTRFRPVKSRERKR